MRFVFACCSSLRVLACVWSAGAALLLSPARAAAQAPPPAAWAPPRVIPFERNYAAGGDAVAAGQLLLGELNCTSCHAAGDSLAGLVERKRAPILDTVGNRVQPQYLLKFLENPQAVKPGTSMPNVLAGLPEAERKSAVEALVHFLATTGAAPESAPLRQAVNRGETLYHSVGCLACHDPRPADLASVKPLATSIPIGTPSRKYTLPGLAEFLQDPLAVRPSGRMPHLLNGGEARDVASFLLNDLEVSSGLQYAYYEGTWDKLPDFSQLKPKETGSAAAFDLSAAKRKDNFALRFDGNLLIDDENEFLFLLGSDDGSRLWIDGQVLIENDGIHPFTQKRKPLKLKKGLHTVAVEYFEQGGGEELQVMVEPKGKPQQPLETLIAVPPKPDRPAQEKFQVKPQLAAQGKVLFANLGCANCHSLKQDGQEVRPTAPTAAALAALKGAGGGCTSETAGRTPFYALSARQRETLAAALAAAKKPAEKPTGETLIARTLARFQCVACHTRGDLGGVEEARNAAFKSDMPEMGDEGRLPPPLAGVGAKLNPAWMKHVFDTGAKDRPYMFTRMPRFGAANVGPLPQLLEAADAGVLKPAPEFSAEEEKRLKVGGQRLVGSQGFGCIKCHTFAGRKAQGIQALSLTDLTQRLRKEWFHQYLFNPQTFRPGTRMPTAFPNGETTLPTVLDGKIDKQIGGIWAYLAEGDKAKLPVGLVTGKIELVAYDEAILYRNFIQGAGPRAIGVGFPEKLNYAFDANELSLAMIWHGGFIDAARHWTGRGQGFEPPLGDGVLKLPPGAPVAQLADSSQAWPAAKAKDLGYQFRGYTLGPKQTPTFQYTQGDLSFSDTIAPQGEGETFVLRRDLVVAAAKPPGDLWRRAVVAGAIEEQKPGVYRIDDAWTLKVSGRGQPVVREAGGKKELLVPLVFEGNKAQLSLEFDW